MASAGSEDIRTDAHQIIDALPENATWDDVMHRIYVRQSIEAGIDDAANDRVVPVDEVRKSFGLNP